MFGDELASPKEISLFLVWLQCQGWAVSGTTKLEKHVRMCSHPTSDFCKSRNYWVYSHTSNFSKIGQSDPDTEMNRVHVRTCRDAPSHPWLGESTSLVTPNPHTKFEPNRPSRSWDTEARSARAHVQRYPPMTCGKHLVHDPQLTHQNWTQSAELFLRYRSAMCTCARAEIPHPWLLHKL